MPSMHAGITDCGTYMAQPLAHGLWASGARCVEGPAARGLWAARLQCQPAAVAQGCALLLQMRGRAAAERGWQTGQTPPAVLGAPHVQPQGPAQPGPLVAAGLPCSGSAVELQPLGGGACAPLAWRGWLEEPGLWSPVAAALLGSVRLDEPGLQRAALLGRVQLGEHRAGSAAAPAALLAGVWLGAGQAAAAAALLSAVQPGVPDRERAAAAVAVAGPAQPDSAATGARRAGQCSPQNPAGGGQLHAVHAEQLPPAQHHEGHMSSWKPIAVTGLQWPQQVC